MNTIKSSFFNLILRSVAIIIVTLFLFCFSLSAQADEMWDCRLNQESFGFSIEQYPMNHLGWAMLNLDVDFRFKDSPQIDPNLYPDFMPIAEKIQQFLTDYPNETDYWEVVNRNLVQFILDQTLTLTSVRVNMAIEKGSNQEFYHRHTVVTLTREKACPLTH